MQQDRFWEFIVGNRQLHYCREAPIKPLWLWLRFMKTCSYGCLNVTRTLRYVHSWFCKASSVWEPWRSDCCWERRILQKPSSLNSSGSSFEPFAFFFCSQMDRFIPFSSNPEVFCDWISRMKLVLGQQGGLMISSPFIPSEIIFPRGTLNKLLNPICCSLTHRSSQLLFFCTSSLSGDN